MKVVNMDNDWPRIVVKGDTVLLGMDDGSWPSFDFDDIQEIIAKETPDFFGGTITFHFALVDGTIYQLYEGIKGMNELFQFMKKQHGVDMNVPFEIFTKRDVTVYRKPK